MAGTEPEQNLVQLSVEEELKNRGIVFDEISNQNLELPIVKSQHSDYLEDHLDQLEEQDASVDEVGRLISNFTTPLDLGIGLINQTASLTEEQIKDIEEKFIGDDRYFIAGDEYKFYRYSLLERALYFRMNAYDNYKIVDGTAEIKLFLDENYQAVKYIQTYQDAIKILDSKTKTISEKMAFQVIDSRVETYIPDNSRIDLSSLSYYRIKNLEDFAVFSPVWEIVFTQPDGTVRSVYVEAKRGTILSPS